MLMQLAAFSVAVFMGLLAVAVVFLLGMRAKSSWMLDVVVWFQRTIINPRQMRSAGTPGAGASVIRHRGRVSGRPYETPVIAVAADDGFVIALHDESRAQWLKNVVASGSATIVNEGHAYEVDRPKITPMQAAEALFSASERRLHRWLGINQCLRVRRIQPRWDGEGSPTRHAAKTP